MEDPKGFSIIEPARNRLRFKGEFYPLYIEEVRFRWGTEPSGAWTTLHKGGKMPDPASKRIRFEMESPELKLNGDAIVATLEFVPYAEMRERFPLFFTPERMQLSRTFRLGREGMVADPDLIVLSEPRDGQKVRETEELEGRVSIPGAYPVILVKAVIGAEWYVQPPVEEIKDGEFTAQVYFGQAGTPAGVRFQVVVVAAANKEQALKQFKENERLKSLPVGLPRSKVITVVRQ
jgi:hypothetical protein